MMDELDSQDKDLSNNDFDEVTLPSKTFEVKHGRILNQIDGLESMQQAVNKILSTDRFVLPIYNENYGHDLKDLVGKNFDYVESEVERMVTEALEADDRVTGVTITSIDLISNNSVEILGQAETIFGNVDIETEVRGN